MLRFAKEDRTIHKIEARKSIPEITKANIHCKAMALLKNCLRPSPSIKKLVESETDQSLYKIKSASGVTRNSQIKTFAINRGKSDL